jgi:hypothetical protein
VSRSNTARLKRTRVRLTRWAPRALGVAYIGLGILLLVRSGTAGALGGLDGDRLVGIVIGWSGLGLALVVGSRIAVLLGLMTPLAVTLASLWGSPQASSPVALAGMVPFQVAGHLAFDSSLAVGRPDALWIWAALGVHLLFLVPATSSILVSLRLRWQAAQRARVRRRTLTIPAAVVDLYARNAYRVLGLPVTAASTRAVVRRRDEIKTLLDVGMPIADNLPGYCSVVLGDPVPLDAGEVGRAVARLQDEPERYREAVLWFRLADEDEKVLSALRSGLLESAEQAWNARMVKSATPGTLYNLAVLSHVRAILSEQASAPPHPSVNADAWKKSFALWKRLLADPRAWDDIARLVSASTHPLVTKEYLATLQKELPARILRVNLALARAALQGGFTEYARKHLRHVEESGLPAEAIAAALDEFFAGEIADARRVLKPLLLQSDALTEQTDFKRMATEYGAIRERLAAIGTQSRLTNLAEEAVHLGRERMVRETDVTFKRLRDANVEYFDGNNALVGQWNTYMTMHNMGISQSPHLRAVARELDARRDVQAAVSKRLEEFAESVRREQVGLEFLRTVAKDAGEGAQQRIEETIRKENEAVARAREQFRETCEHFERNRTGMNNQVGA